MAGYNEYAHIKKQCTGNDTIAHRALCSKIADSVGIPHRIMEMNYIQYDITFINFYYSKEAPDHNSLRTIHTTTEDFTSTLTDNHFIIQYYGEYGHLGKGESICCELSDPESLDKITNFIKTILLGRAKLSLVVHHKRIELTQELMRSLLELDETIKRNIETLGGT